MLLLKLKLNYTRENNHGDDKHKLIFFSKTTFFLSASVVFGSLRQHVSR